MPPLKPTGGRGVDPHSDTSNNSTRDAARRIGIPDKRYYSTIREDGAENLQDLSETAGLPKYLIHGYSGARFFLSSHMNDEGEGIQDSERRYPETQKEVCGTINSSYHAKGT
jgi:hypothetical protein